MPRCTITLTVDTANISPGNINGNVEFKDSSGGSQHGNPENFTSDIQIGEEVYWVGRAKDRSTGDLVTIDKILYEAETNILGETELHGNAQGAVLGMAVHGSNGDQQEYGIYFSVTVGNNTPVQFYIDPKLRIQPS